MSNHDMNDNDYTSQRDESQFGCRDSLPIPYKKLTIDERVEALDADMEYDEEREIFIHMHDQEEFLSDGYSTISSPSEYNKDKEELDVTNQEINNLLLEK